MLLARTVLVDRRGEEPIRMQIHVGKQLAPVMRGSVLAGTGLGGLAP